MIDSNRIIDASVKHGYRIIGDTGGSLIRVPSITEGVFYGSTVLDGVVQPTYIEPYTAQVRTSTHSLVPWPFLQERGYAVLRLRATNASQNRQGGELLIDIM